MSAQRRVEDDTTDYTLTDAEAEYLKAVVLLPAKERFDLIRRYRLKYGAEAADRLFAQFVGLSNSVVANNREMIEILGLCTGELHPHNAHQVNLPTVFGALCGVALANSVNPDKGCCHGCAFRKGAPANQSPITTLDALYVQDGGEAFLCHETEGEPRAVCRGHAQAMKARRESPDA